MVTSAKKKKKKFNEKKKNKKKTKNNKRTKHDKSFGYYTRKKKVKRKLHDIITFNELKLL